jgi:hypothetical protein
MRFELTTLTLARWGMSVKYNKINCLWSCKFRFRVCYWFFWKVLVQHARGVFGAGPQGIFLPPPRHIRAHVSR